MSGNTFRVAPCDVRLEPCTQRRGKSSPILWQSPCQEDGHHADEAFDPLQRSRHARYFEDGVVHHVVFRTLQGFFLLNPDRQGRLRRIAAGVLAKARETFPSVKTTPLPRTP